MALTSPAKPAPGRRESFFWSRLHFLIRLIGLTGLLAVCAGLVLAGLSHVLDSWANARAALRGAVSGGPPGEGAYLFLGGLLAGLLALVVEAGVILRRAAGRRSVIGVNAAVQMGLAVALLVGVNVYSFRHSLRFDWTRDRQFTLSNTIRTDLARLTDETTIVVYQMHKPYARLTDKADRYDLAAERKVVEKVKDLAALLREEGQRLQVVVLDVEDPQYDNELARLKEQAPELGRAIEKAPENSIFFHGQGRLQQMSFNDFYRLDRTDSQAESNLVLRYAGLHPITNRVLNLEERRPRVGILDSHEAFSTESSHEGFTLAGARKALEAEGFEVRDIITRRFDITGLSAAVDTLEDSRLDRLKNERDDFEALIQELEDQVKKLTAVLDVLPKGELAEVNRRLNDYYRLSGSGLELRVTEDKRAELTTILDNKRGAARTMLNYWHEQLEQTNRELTTLDEDAVGERRRLSDLYAKLSRELADCDLLILARPTLLSYTLPVVPPTFHDLNRAQALAVKDFLRAGKPVLAAFGPINVPADDEEGPRRPDALENLLAELGVTFGKRTVLFNEEIRDFARQRSPRSRWSSKPLVLPPLRLEAEVETELEALARNRYAAVREPLALLGSSSAGPLHALPFLGASSVGPLRALPVVRGIRSSNPVSASFQATNRETGNRLQLRVRFPRPVTLDPLVARTLPYQPELLVTSSAAWNDDQPYSTSARPIPGFVPPKPDDPDRDTPDARRRGAFCVGVLFERAAPESWYDSPEKPHKVRVAALGQPALFIGQQLEPANEKLLIDTCNWLVSRDDRLAHAGQEFRYPRVQLDPRKRALWLWGTCLGLPVLFFYLGLVVLLARRLR